MHTYQNRRQGWVTALAVLLLLFAAVPARAYILGLDQTASVAPIFNLRAKSGYISTADGSSLFFWGYANEGNHQVQYPGPTMIVTQGVPVTVTLVNNLSEPTSIVFPGQNVTATGGSPGLLTREAPPDRLTTVTYTFTPDRPGTFTYYSGSHSDLQVEMGMIGALIVRPAVQDLVDCPNQTMSAYGDCRSAYDHEYLFLQSDMDPVIHDQVEFGQMDRVETTAFWPALWFINGRNAPDTMGMNCEPTLPTQPYNIMPRITPGQRLLMRVIGGGRDLHPFHTHGNNFEQIARDATLLTTDPLNVAAAKPLVPGAPLTFGTVPDLAVSDFTLTTAPGATYDAIFTWSGKNMGWDVYGSAPHTCTPDPATGEGFDAFTKEYCPGGLGDHTLPFPVTLPSVNVLALGATYSGSPFLGAAGFLPPGQGGNNPNSGYFFMWHSHNEKEMINYDIFPGGLMTMMVVEPPGIIIPTMPMPEEVCP